MWIAYVEYPERLANISDKFQSNTMVITDQKSKQDS